MVRHCIEHEPLLLATLAGVAVGVILGTVRVWSRVAVSCFSMTFDYDLCCNSLGKSSDEQPYECVRACVRACGPMPMNAPPCVTVTRLLVGTGRAHQALSFANLSPTALEVIGLPGDLLMRTLKMLVLPLITASVMAGGCQAGQQPAEGQRGSSHNGAGEDKNSNTKHGVFKPST